jgi:hypothetical protein
MRLKRPTCTFKVGSVYFHWATAHSPPSTDFCAALLKIPILCLSLLSCRWVKSFKYMIIMQERASISSCRCLYGHSGYIYGSILAYFAGSLNMYILCVMSIKRWTSDFTFETSCNSRLRLFLPNSWSSFIVTSFIVSILSEKYLHEDSGLEKYSVLFRIVRIE